jgi:Ca2+-binding EF-hand superfamily protein
MPRKSTKRCSLRRLFDAMDANHSGDVTMAEVTKAFKKAAGKDGILTFKEMTTACRRTPRTKKSARRGAGAGDDMLIVAKLFKQLDTDSSGYVTESEFFDEDKDGKTGLSKEEWMKNFTGLTADETRVAEALFAKLSKGDGNISHEDFKAAACPEPKLSTQELLKVYSSAVRGSARRCVRSL